MKKSIILLCFLILTVYAAFPMAHAQGFPCVIRGTVTVNGVPTQGIFVYESPYSNDTTNSSGGYGVNAPSGSKVTVTAMYNGQSRTITVITPTSGGFVDGQNIAITNTQTAPGQTGQSTQAGGIPWYLWLVLVGVVVVVIVTAEYIILRKK